MPEVKPVPTIKGHENKQRAAELKRDVNKSEATRIEFEGESVGDGERLK
jgi:hypothetical protein